MYVLQLLSPNRSPVYDCEAAQVLQPLSLPPDVDHLKFLQVQESYFWWWYKLLCLYRVHMLS